VVVNLRNQVFLLIAWNDRQIVFQLITSPVLLVEGDLTKPSVPGKQETRIRWRWVPTPPLFPARRPED
jgi:hypothetical protein